MDGTGVTNMTTVYMVLGKVWAIALKYNFRMPPYYTLLLRSLASFEGLAMAGDPNFNTFEDSYPYVVRKLLSDNSLDTRKILHSVMLNKRKELQWKRVALFLRVGATSKGLHMVSKSATSTEDPSNKISDTVNLALKLLLSKDGVVVTRLLMTAVSKNIELGLAALRGEKGPAYDRIILNARMADHLLGCEGAEDVSTALDRARDAIDSGNALN